MNPESATLIWVAKFDSQSQLSNYVDWKYFENENDPICSFANDVGLKHFDSDFLETAFVLPEFNFLAEIEKISFAEHFRIQLKSRLNQMNFVDKNAIISLSGKRDIHGSINENLFNFIPTVSNKTNLQFIGFFKY